MGDLRRVAAVGSLGLLVLSAGGVLAVEAVDEASAEGGEVHSLEKWALRPVIRDLALSPDGKHLAMLRIHEKRGNPVIEVLETDGLSKEPFRTGADHMEIAGILGWVSDTSLLFLLRAQVRRHIEGFNQGVYEFKLALVDVAKKTPPREFLGGEAGIASVLPKEPDKIIVEAYEGISREARYYIRPASYYELDLREGTKKLLFRGRLARGDYRFDEDGRAWMARSFDVREAAWYYRPPGEDSWRKFHSRDPDSLLFDDFRVVGQDDANPEHALVLAHNGHDKLGLWSFNMATGEFAEAIYRRSDVDVGVVVSHSNAWTHPDRIVGVGYATDRVHIEYFDAAEEALHEQVRKLVPHAHDVRVVSRSREGSTLIFQNKGPRDPGTYYLLHGGNIETIGSEQPLLHSDELADVEYIKYKSRDGHTVAAYVTVPKGEPPFPLVVMPHGGPQLSEYVDYDEWGQMLASQGYLVLQPQFRGSLGYGTAWQKEMYADGAWGTTMQDDKDDGALHLVKTGLADPDRMAMFGWSYGGYAAAIAASREPQHYQCVIAGAGVYEPIMQVNYYRSQMRGEDQERWVRVHETALSPVDEAKNVNVPMLVIHGDVDQRVPLDHAKKYLKELDKHGKSYRYVELERADHFSDTLFFDHKLKLYQSMTEFLADECGPGGLL